MHVNFEMLGIKGIKLVLKFHTLYLYFQIKFKNEAIMIMQQLQNAIS